MTEEVFEPSLESLKEEIANLKKNMVSSQETPTAAPKKEKKKRKPLTEERKVILRAQLKKGREASLAKRRANRELKKLDRAKKVVAKEEEIVLSTKSNQELQNELKSLREQMKTKQEEPKPVAKKEAPPPPRPRPPPPKKEPEPEPKNEMMASVIEETPKPYKTPSWLLKKKRFFMN